MNMQELQEIQLKNLLILGSEYIYHIENSIIDHVTNSATGINIIEK